MEGIINKILSRHLISYARDEKWLHDLMESKKDKAQLYKKAMRFYIANAGDPEFNNTIIHAKLAPVTVGYGSVCKFEDVRPEDIEADASEIGNIMNGL